MGERGRVREGENEGKNMREEMYERLKKGKRVKKRRRVSGLEW